jgi:hypothetical protein
MRRLLLGALLLGSAPLVAQDAPKPWPRDYTINAWKLRLHQPQVESWKADTIVARAAIMIKPPTDTRERYGVVWLRAQTVIDRETGTVELRGLHVDRLYFASLPDSGKEWGDSLRARVGAVDKTVQLAALEHSLALTQAEAGAGAPADSAPAGTPVRNLVPEMIVAQVPTLLVLVDGEPAWRDVEGTTFQRLINTPVLILREKSAEENLYLRFAKGWMVSEGLAGEWLRTEEEVPEVFTTIMTTAAEGGTDLMDEPAASLADAVEAGKDIKVVVSTRPAELIETWGDPVLEPIAGTNLLWVNNTAADLFVDVASSDWIALVSGRWFRASSLEGPWRFEPYDSLPGDFTAIPATHEKATVLASIPGSPQAVEAVVANNTPQMATVSRAVATTTPFFDGEPELKPIEGTTMQYVVNTPGAVVQVTPTTFFTVDAGVWFVSNTVKGPYTVADKVAPEIYTIPASSSLYYITFVKVYSSTDSTVTTGYTGGYNGAVTTTNNVVVYGTGYTYPPYVGGMWFGAPPMYGMGVRFVVVGGGGWHVSMGGAWGRPPYYYGGYHGGYHGGRPVNINNGGYRGPGNAYNNWRGNGVQGRPSAGTRPATGAVASQRPRGAAGGNVWNTRRPTTSSNVGNYNRGSGKFQPNSSRVNQARGTSRPSVGQMRSPNGMTSMGRGSQPRSASPRDNVYGSSNGSVWRDNSRSGGGWSQMGGAGGRQGASAGTRQSPPRDVSRERTARGRAEYRAPQRSMSRGGGGMRGGGGGRRR